MQICKKKFLFFLFDFFCCLLLLYFTLTFFISVYLFVCILLVVSPITRLIVLCVYARACILMIVNLIGLNVFYWHFAFMVTGRLLSSGGPQLHLSSGYAFLLLFFTVIASVIQFITT